MNNYHIYQNDFYRYELDTSNTSLLGQWKFNDEITNFSSGESKEVALIFTSYDPSGGYGNRYYSIKFDSDTMKHNRSGPTGTTYTFSTKTWIHEDAKTITITEAPTDEAFIVWLRANATPATYHWVKYVAAT